MRKKWQLIWDAFLDGFTGTVAVPPFPEDSSRLPSKYRRGRSDIERAWLAVGRYLEIAIEEHREPVPSEPQVGDIRQHV